VLLTVIGNLVCYQNNTLEVLRLGGNRGLLNLEVSEGDSFDE
jgi:hypothetical protein